MLYYPESSSNCSFPMSRSSRLKQSSNHAHLNRNEPNDGFFDSHIFKILLSDLSIASSRVFISVTLVMIAYLFDGAIGIGTLINALLSGVIIKLFIPYVTIIKAKTE